jgi:type VI secretion system secreted protein VgrG
MPSDPTQDNRPMVLTTGCGDNVFLLTGFSGQEVISQLFHYRIEAVVPQSKIGSVDWTQLLGKPVSVSLKGTDGSEVRQFNGICSRVAQGESESGDTPVTHFRLEVVPKLWLLSRAANSRVFHQQSVHDIVTAVLNNYGITPTWQADSPTDPRDYCVQYRETDFNFVSRLLEEEGLCYYFSHAGGDHTMIVSAPPKTFPAVSPATVTYHPASGGVLPDDVVSSWEKTQELRSEAYTLWDYSFQKTGDNYQSQGTILASVAVGAATHTLGLGNTKLELYDSPGEYAQRYDGVGVSGGSQTPDISGIGADGTRTAGIRMQEDTVSALLIQASGCCRQFCAGYQFTLNSPLMAHAAGSYVLTSVQHACRQGTYSAGSTGDFSYQNSFTCIPAALPFRPARLTPKPVVHGTQTAVVVGTSGSEIFTDQYGRVKVQFHWDRLGTSDPNSSCWIRVGTMWAGVQWGTIFIPRIGQEVIVAFEEGDPDQPIIVGSVYNDQHMPPYTLPDNMTQSGILSRSTLNGGADNFNQLQFEDKKDSEFIYFHAEKDFTRVVENNDSLNVGATKKDKGDQTVTIYNNQTTKIGTQGCDDGSQSITVFNDQTVAIGDPQAPSGCQTITVYKDRTETVKTGNETITIEQGNRSIDVKTGNDSHKIDTGNRSVEIDMGNDTLEIKMGNQSTKIDLGSSTTEAMQSITLKVGQNSIVINQQGVTISGMTVSVQGQAQVQVQGALTTVSADGKLTLQGGITMIN